ncbi:MAG: ribosome silencing factor [Terriglobales bacterium]|jgi:ribosome-associated protein
MKRKSKAKTAELRELVYEAAMACQDKKAEGVTVLEMDKTTGAFTDYFVICSGSNPRQIQAIFDAVEERLARQGVRAMYSEGYRQAEWAILDYFDFVVHIFSEKTRAFRGLERLWKSAKRLELADLKPAPAPKKKPAPKRTAVRKPQSRKKSPSAS